MKKINTSLLKYKNPTSGEFEQLHAFVGKSAYDTAKEGGYTGTEEEFAAALANVKTLSEIEAYIDETFLGGSW